MGGKPKSANRTKNNTKPSSSGRSALTLSLGQFPKSYPVSQFVFSNNEDNDTTIDQNFQLVFKKISKKDSTTKLKGLQELAELVKLSELEVLKGILPLWARHYNQLSTDLDHKVREATQVAHYEIVLKVKRNIAPYLKQIMAIWFVSPYDNYAPAASIADQALKYTFSPTKFQEAVVFCQESILSYISYNLLTENIQGTLDPHLSPEEIEAKYERIIVCSLQGYSLYLEIMAVDQIENVTNSKIISDKLFWNLAKNKSPLIRASWYTVISTILRKAIFLFEKKKQELLTLIVNNLNEKDPVVLPKIFDCLLMSLSSISEWWQFISVENLFLPKLNKILTKGGAGNATIIYPNLLPLLSQLHSVIADSNRSEFYNTFLRNILTGLKLKPVANDRAEAVAICTSFLECLQYIVIKNISHRDLCESLIKQQLLATFEWILTNEHTLHRTLYYQTSSFLDSILRKQPTNHNYVIFFFNNLQAMFIQLLNASLETDIASLSEKQLECLHALKQLPKPKKGTVKFNLHTKIKSPILNKIKQNDTKPSEEYLTLLMTTVFTVFADYVEFITKTHSNIILERLCGIILDYDKKEIFNLVLEKMRLTNPQAKMMNVYSDLLKKWLNFEKIYSKNVIDLIFKLIIYLNNEERQLILNELLELEQPNCVAWCLSEALSFPYNEMLVVQEWLKEKKIGEFILSIADMELADECPPELDRIYKLILTENNRGECLLKDDIIRELIKKVTAAVSTISNNSLHLETCCTLASHLCNTMCSDSSRLTYCSELIVEMIKLASKPLDEECILAETLQEFNTTWHDALTLLLWKFPPKDINNLFELFAKMIENLLFWEREEVAKIQRVDHLIKIILQFVRAIYKSIPSAIQSLYEICFETDTWADLKDSVAYYSKIAEYIQGGFLNPHDPLQKLESKIHLDEIRILQYFIYCYVRYMVFSAKVTPCNEEYNRGNEDDDDENGPSDTFLSKSKFGDKVLTDGLYALVLSESFLLNYANVKYYEDMLLYNTLLGDRINQTNFNQQILCETEKSLVVNSMKYGWIWCTTTSYFYRKLLNKTDLSHICRNTEPALITASPTGMLHSRQVFVSSDENMQELSNRAANIENIENLYDKPCPSYLILDESQWFDNDEIIQGIRRCTDILGEDLNKRGWDAVNLSFDKFIVHCAKEVESFWKCTQYQALLAALIRLYISVYKIIKEFQRRKINIDMIDEWNHVVKMSAHEHLIKIWGFLAQTFASSQIAFCHIPFLKSLTELIDYLDVSIIFQRGEARNAFIASCGLLSSNRVDAQQLGYKMILLLLPGLIQIDNAIINREGPTDTFVFNQFGAYVMKYEEIVNSLLVEFKIGEDSCKVEPSYDSFTYTLAYLLLWDFILLFYEQSPVELRSTYVELDWLKSGFQNFITNIVKLMPLDIIQCNESPLKESMNDTFLKKSFNSSTFFDCDNQTIEELACYLYKASFTNFPAMVRQWWAGIDYKSAHIIEKITTAYISSHICKDELNAVVEHESRFKNMKVKVLPSIRQIIAVYKIDDAKIELTITLPPNYPLIGPAVNCNRQISGISKNKQWLFEFQKCVLHQNGRVRDGLVIWNHNLDKKFDKVEECYICYSILHPINYQLPKLSCRTCKNRFHSTCLYTWFSSSNKSSCPICRNLF